MRRGLWVLCLLAMPAAADEPFEFFPAGDLAPGSGWGTADTSLWVPGMRFPIGASPAFANSQVYGYGGFLGPGGGQCHPENYDYPWRDNYCEKRQWAMPLCPSGQGHQGQDIRPATCVDNVHLAVAAEAGVITSVGTYSVYLTGNSGRVYRYLHLKKSSLAVSLGQSVAQGAPIGYVSDEFGNTPTSIHLHFDIRANVPNVGNIFVPTYTSLVASYEALLVSEGKLTVEPLEPPEPPPVVAIDAEPTGPGDGYWVLLSNGDVVGSGAAVDLGGLDNGLLNLPARALARHPNDDGYWVVAEDGGVFTFGSAGYYGNLLETGLTGVTALGIESTPSGVGYWIATSAGHVRGFGDASDHGDVGGIVLNAPVVALEATSDGGGYWLVAADGGIFALGNAGFFGSMGGQPLAEPIVGMRRTPSGAGYWLYASDGGVFAFGDAAFFGSAAGSSDTPVVGMHASPTGDGYWLLEEDGDVHAFGDSVVGDDGFVCYPEPESCNGLDDNCDGVPDDGVLNPCGACGPVPSETCNGQDDDCDGQTDEGVLNACGECGPEPAEACNGEDDDCDGQTDEGVLNSCGECGPAPTEACNGEDDDCDGQTDEGLGLGDACETEGPTCLDAPLRHVAATGVVACAPSGDTECSPVVTPCDDDDPSTVDTCTAETGCIHTPVEPNDETDASDGTDDSDETDASDGTDDSDGTDHADSTDGGPVDAADGTDARDSSSAGSDTDGADGVDAGDRVDTSDGSGQDGDNTTTEPATSDGNDTGDGLDSDGADGGDSKSATDASAPAFTPRPTESGCTANAPGPHPGGAPWLLLLLSPFVWRRRAPA